MNLEQAKQFVGKMVWSYDPSPKLSVWTRPHGPYLLKQVTKGGLCLLGNYRNDNGGIPPRFLELYLDGEIPNPIPQFVRRKQYEESN